MRGSRAALLLHLRARFVQRHVMVLRYLLRLRKTTWSTRSPLQVRCMKLQVGNLFCFWGGSASFWHGSARGQQRSPMRGSRAALVLLHLRARFVPRHEMVLRYLLRLRRLEQGAHGGKTTWSTRSSLKVKGMKLPMGVIKVLPFFGTAGVMDSIVFEPFGNGCYCFEPTWNRRNNDFCEDVPRGLPLSNRHPIVSNRVGTVRTTALVRMSHAVCRFRAVIPLFRTEFEPSGQPFLRGCPTQLVAFEPPSFCFEPGPTPHFEGSPSRNAHFAFVSNRILLFRTEFEPS